MKYGTHNFYHNFCNANGANDDTTQRNMVIDEITKVIADNRPGFILALQNAGIKISKNPTVKEITKAFLNNIKNNKLQRDIAVLVLQYNDLHEGTVIKKQSQATSNLEMLNADGKANNQNIVVTDKPAVDVIATSIDSVGDTIASDKTGTTKTNIEKDIVNSISADPSTGGISFGKIVLWSAIIGSAFYFGKKLLTKKQIA